MLSERFPNRESIVILNHDLPSFLHGGKVPGIVQINGECAFSLEIAPTKQHTQDIKSQRPTVIHLLHHRES